MLWFEILEISKESDLKIIKKAYFKKIKEYPPDDFEEEYIKINKAYREALNYRKKDRADNLYENLIEIIEKKKRDREENILIREIIKKINKENFMEENEKILKVIKRMKEKELEKEMIYLIALVKKRLRELNLMGLSEAYERLENSILEES